MSTKSEHVAVRSDEDAMRAKFILFLPVSGWMAFQQMGKMG